jgi:hypothetical protein
MNLTLHYDWQGQGSDKPRNGQGPTLSVTRAQPELVINSDGYYEEVPANELRFEYGRYNANIHPDSNDFSTGSYFKLNCTVAQDAEDRNGIANNAWSVSSDGLGAGLEFCGPRGDGLAAVLTSAINMPSWYVKAGTVDWVYAYSSGTGQSQKTWFNIREGYIGTRQETHNWVGIHPAGNGYYRIWIAPRSQYTLGDRFYLSAATGDGVEGVVNTSVQSDLFYVQDFMAEDVTAGKWLRQNYIQGSESPFDTGNWLVNARAEKLATTIIGPNGGKACELRALNLGGSNDSSIRIVPTMELADWAWYSVDVKKDTLDYVNLRIVGNDPQSGDCYFNFLTGAFTNVTNTRFSTHVEQKRDGWWRISVLHRVEVAGVNYYINLAATDGSTNVPLDGVSNVLFADPQVQIAKPFETKPGAYLQVPVERQLDGETEYYPSAYIETGASAVTQRIDAPCVLKGDGRTGGLRIDHTRENKARHTQDFTNVVYSLSSVVVNPNLVKGPDGRLIADEIRDNNDAASGATAIGQFVTGTLNDKILGGYIVKQGSNQWVALGSINWTTPVNSWAYFDIQNGVLGSKDAGIDNQGMKDLGNGWYFIWITITLGGVDSNGSISLYLAANDGVTTVTRNGTNYVYVWHHQVEEKMAGALDLQNPTTPIQTEGSTVTIDKDDIVMNGAGDVDWLNLAKGTMYVRYYSDIGDMGISIPFCSIDNGSTTYMQFTSGGTGSRNLQPGFQVRSQGSAIDGINGGLTDIPNDGTVHSLAGSWRGLDAIVGGDRVRAAFNGVVQASVAADDTDDLDTVDRFAIGRSGAGTSPHMAGVYQELRYYDGAANDEQLQNMTRSENQIFPGYDPNRKKKAAIDAALWNKAMNARTKEADSDGDYTPFNNVG